MLKLEKGRLLAKGVGLIVVGGICLGTWNVLAQEGPAQARNRPARFVPAARADSLQSLLEWARQEQEVEFSKPLEVFPATLEGTQQLERYATAIYPSRRELAIYSLDWEPTLAAARARAAREQRPVFFVMVTNFTGPTNFFSGHC